MAGPDRLRPKPAVLAAGLLCCLIDGVLQAAGHGLTGSARWRPLAYQYGAFWTGLLHDWQPNFPLQPVTMFSAIRPCTAGSAIFWAIWQPFCPLARW